MTHTHSYVWRTRFRDPLLGLHVNLQRRMLFDQFAKFLQGKTLKFAGACAAVSVCVCVCLCVSLCVFVLLIRPTLPCAVLFLCVLLCPNLSLLRRALVIVSLSFCLTLLSFLTGWWLVFVFLLKATSQKGTLFVQVRLNQFSSNGAVSACEKAGGVGGGGLARRSPSVPRWFNQTLLRFLVKETS